MSTDSDPRELLWTIWNENDQRFQVFVERQYALDVAAKENLKNFKLRAYRLVTRNEEKSMQVCSRGG